MSSADKNYPEELRRITSNAQEAEAYKFIEHVTSEAFIAANNGSVLVRCTAPSRYAARVAQNYFERRGFSVKLSTVYGAGEHFPGPDEYYLTVSWPEPKPEPWWRRLADYFRRSRNCS